MGLFLPPPPTSPLPLINILQPSFYFGECALVLDLCAKLPLSFMKEEEEGCGEGEKEEDAKADKETRPDITLSLSLSSVHFGTSEM